MSDNGTYADLLHRRRNIGADSGFEPTSLPDSLYDFQRVIVEWAVRKGRAAIFADCGLGKTIMQLAWANNVALHTGRPVMILTPLAVAHQTQTEGRRFGFEVKRADRGKGVGGPGIVISNYQRIHRFDPTPYAGIVLDESSILKSFNGATRRALTQFMLKIPYRLLCTATAAPNDHTELGTSSEALGHMGHVDMLSRFFRNDNRTTDSRGGRMHGKRTQWRFKGHAETAFWRWVCSWARACRKPSDLGFSDEAFVLPELMVKEHVIEAKSAPDGFLFPVLATNWREERAERRRTIEERCAHVAGLVEPHDSSIVWCHLNDEADLLERLIPDSVQVSGRDSLEDKEGKLRAFAEGNTKRLITKPKIGAWGLNFQRCAHVVTFVSHSYEQYYQSVRRCWRFGQTRPVTVDVVATEGELNVLANLRAKSKAADVMFGHLVSEMSNALHVESPREFTTTPEVPSWLRAN